MNVKGHGLKEGPARLPVRIGLLAFLGISTFFLWAEHKAHILGALPWLLLLLCPVIHLFMHRGHGGHHGSGGAGPGSDDREFPGKGDVQ
ncbi:MAG: DUF2933 domain-containing protein [Deltaproteobacteria bacterium]|nr:DUF2933 domain-containing protein [Deltaproteobacteria bacterium]